MLFIIPGDLSSFSNHLQQGFVVLEIGIHCRCSGYLFLLIEESSSKSGSFLPLCTSFRMSDEVAALVDTLSLLKAMGLIGNKSADLLTKKGFKNVMPTKPS